MPRQPAQIIRDALNDGSLGEYPLPHDETEERWRAAALAAVDHLEDRALLRDGEPVARHLLAIAGGPLSPLLDPEPGRTRLLGEVLRHLSDPGEINQGLKGTCAATCVQTHLAERHPETYARIMAGLVSPQGEVALHNGELLRRDERALAWHAQEGERGPASRLFQVAAMELAYPGLDYDNLVDGFQGRSGRLSTGMGLGEFDRLLEGVTGERWDTLSDQISALAEALREVGLDLGDEPDLHRDGMDIIRRSTSRGEPVFVTLDTPTADGAERAPLSHKLRVLAFAGDRVIYDDPIDPTEPWIPGASSRVENTRGRCSMAATDFERMMVELSYKPEFWVPPG